MVDTRDVAAIPFDLIVFERPPFASSRQVAPTSFESSLGIRALGLGSRIDRGLNHRSTLCRRLSDTPY